MRLLTMGRGNAKTSKSDKSGKYLTAIMHLAPARSSGYQVCASASAGCIAACLNTSGRGRFDKTQQARIRKTKFFMLERESFKSQLVRETQSFIKRCDKQGKLPAIRLNGTSDIIWEKVWPELFELFPNVQFYDYTKHAHRCMARYQRRHMPQNYHLTFSRSESNQSDVRRVLRSGVCNVAVVFDTANYPTIWCGKPVYSMDSTDLRFLDPPGVGALYEKPHTSPTSDGLEGYLDRETGFIVSSKTGKPLKGGGQIRAAGFKRK